MEVMNDRDTRRTLLAALAPIPDGDEFAELLSRDFELIRCEGAPECLALLRENLTRVSAVIIDADMAQEDDYAFLRAVAGESALAAVPVLIGILREPTDDDARCLELGALDMISKPYHPTLVRQRVENAIRLKDSASFLELERILRELPSNIFLKDDQGRYVFCTHYWHHLDMGDDPNWTIQGKTDLEVRKDRDNAIKAMEADREILRTGKGTSYVVEINTDGQQEFMELIKEPVFDERGRVTGIIALINDVTETELIKRQLERSAYTDELTGLGNRRAFDEFLEALPTRDTWPLAVLSVDCDGLKQVNDSYGHLVGDEYIRMTALAMRDLLPEEAQAFRVGGDEFVAFIPVASMEEARALVLRLRAYGTTFRVGGDPISVSSGLALLAGPDDDVRAAIAEADRAMYALKATRRRARR